MTGSGRESPVEPPRPADEPAGGGELVDAERFLAVAERLRAARLRIERGAANDHRRAQWQRLLVTISNIAKTDLDRADETLTRLEADLDRHLGEE
jgi:hypothetical protein